jgi:hypothetical protein
MKAATAQIQSTFDFAMREINALEGQIATAEDDADAMLWEQALLVVAQWKKGMSQETLAAQWKDRAGLSYSQKHVSYTVRAAQQYTAEPRPRFREVYNKLANTSKLKVHHSSESVEHYTPPAIVQLVTACLGEIDLDPCSNDAKTIPAKQHYTVKENGLELPWRGRVYMNPPYGDGIDRWVTRLCAEHDQGTVSEAIALVPARPGSGWWSQFRNCWVCFINGRLVFEGNDSAAPFPSAVYYLGPARQRFYNTFCQVGDVWQRVNL